jgi:hypothetical protein
MIILLLVCFGVTVGPGWSDPVLVTDSANTTRPIQFISRDSLGRFHLAWENYNGQPRIGYKMFALDGTTLYPETMISRDVHSAYLSTMTMGDSLFAFWRESDPVYYAIRSLADGSEITPATYLFTTYTMYPFIRACPDSLGRLHVLHNKGSDVIYAVWNPAPGSGFTTEYEWVIEGADAGGVLLVDGNRVHVVVQDPIDHDYSYLQYDLEGNTVVPLTDFTDEDLINCGRFPKLKVDSSGNLLVLEDAFSDPVRAIYLWKLDGATGELLIDLKPLVIPELPIMNTCDEFILEPLPVLDQFYLCWSMGYDNNKIFNLVFDSDGDIIVDWHIAYDYSDEDPEDTRFIDGVTDEQGNLYVVFAQVETEPQVDYFPTFGWFDYDYVSIDQQQTTAIPGVGFSFSCNPVTGSVTVQTSSESQTLRVFDISGREVSSIRVSNGAGVWTGENFSGERLPPGIYSILEESGFIQRITLLGR